MSIISCLFGGIGSIYVEEGLYAYLGIDEVDLRFSNSDDYFREPLIRKKTRAQQMMRFSSFIGALIAFTTTDYYLMNLN